MPKTALDVRARLGVMFGWTDADLEQVPIYEGKVLKKGKVYLDLTSPEYGEIRPVRDTPADPTSIYVEKSQVDPRVWDTLVTSWTETPFAYGTNAPVQGAFAGDGGVATSRGGEGATSVGAAGLYIGEGAKAIRRRKGKSRLRRRRKGR